MQDTKSTPDAQKRHGYGQLDPSGLGYAHYEIIADVTSSSPTVLARIVATNTDQSSGDPDAMEKNTEYWVIDRAALRLADHPSVVLTKSAHEWTDPPPFTAKSANFRTSQAPTWDKVPADGEFLMTEEGDGIHVTMSYTNDAWVGTIAFVRGPGSSNMYLFVDGGAPLALKDPLVGSSFSGSLPYTIAAPTTL